MEEHTSPAAQAAPPLPQLRKGCSPSTLDSTASALAAMSSFLSQSKGKYRAPLASVPAEQLCTEDFWREYAFYLTFQHGLSGRRAGLEATTINVYLRKAFGAAEQLLRHCRAEGLL